MQKWQQVKAVLFLKKNDLNSHATGAYDADFALLETVSTQRV